MDGFYFYFYKKKQNLKYEFYLYMTGEADDVEYNPIIIQNKKVLD